MEIRKARSRDVEHIHSLIQHFAEEGLMLPRSTRSLYEHLQNFVVAIVNGKVVGTAGLHVLWKDLGEIRSLAVSSDAHGSGIGRELVKFIIQEANRIGLGQVLSLTYQTEFFHKQGFQVVDRNSLPHKVWKDCVVCKKFYHCDEVAMVFYTEAFVGTKPEPKPFQMITK